LYYSTCHLFCILKVDTARSCAIILTLQTQEEITLADPVDVLVEQVIRLSRKIDNTNKRVLDLELEVEKLKFELAKEKELAAFMREECGSI
jgi:hypothetical protein